MILPDPVVEFLIRLAAKDILDHQLLVVKAHDDLPTDSFAKESL
jgi:hypothetical protein